MDDALDKIAEKLPDLHFDWYARLLPGLAAVMLFLVGGSSAQQKYMEDHPWQIVLVAYLVGHFIQPASSWIVKEMEKRKGREKTYADYKARSDRLLDLVGKVSKAHAEAVSMMSTAFLSVALFAWHALRDCEYEWIYLVIALVCFIFSRERIGARGRKIGELPKNNAEP